MERQGSTIPGPCFLTTSVPHPLISNRYCGHMTSRGYPLWLLRDWTAFFAFLIAFWTFVFAGSRAGRRVARGIRLSELELQTLFQLYANAESRLDHAIWRQAWRACGYSAKHATFVQMPAPANAEELEARFLSYNRALREMEHLVIAYADDLRRRFKLSRAQVGDPNAWRDPLRHATKTSRATSPGYAGGGKQPARLGSITCNASGGGGMRALGAHDGGGLSACARGPPPYSRLPTPIASDAPRLRTPAHVPRNPLAPPRGNSAPPSARYPSVETYVAAPLHPSGSSLQVSGEPHPQDRSQAAHQPS